MSLEQSLQNIADALNNLANAVQGKGQIPIDLTKGQHSEATAGKSSKPAADKPKQDTAKPDSAATPPTAAAQATAPAEKGASSEKPLDYDADLKPRFLELVEVCGRQAALDIIAGYKSGAKTLKDALEPAQYADALAKINAAIAAKG